MKPARKASPEPTVLTTVSSGRDARRGRRAAAPHLEAGDAAVRRLDDDVARAHLADHGGGVDDVLLVVELVADEVLGLAQVGDDEVGTARARRRRSGSPALSSTTKQRCRRMRCITAA